MTMNKGVIVGNIFTKYTLNRLELNKFKKLVDMDLYKRALIFSDFVYFQVLFHDLFLRYWKYNKGVKKHPLVLKNMKWIVSVLMITIKYFFRRLTINKLKK